VKKPTIVRRTLGLAAAILAGILTTFVLASPASAHYSYIRGTSSCVAETGTYSVTWSVWNSETDKVEDLIVVTTDPAGGAGDIHVGATIGIPQATLTGVQTGIPGTAHSASLSVRGHWAKDNFTEDLKTETIELDGNCKPGSPSPSASANFSCDGTAVVTVANAASATHSATFVITGNGFSHTTSAIAPGGASVNVSVPASAAGDIKVKVGDTVIATFNWARPADCAAVKVAIKSDCNSLTVSLENPDPNAPITATVVSGTNSKDVTIGTGKTELVTFPAGPGPTVATVTFKDGTATTLAAHAVAAADVAAPITLSWVNPGAVCTPPPELPNTGAKVGGVIASGVALVGIGIGMLLYVRRRKARMAA
jgi:LPXTG-motif cell wall-anchored protein